MLLLGDDKNVITFRWKIGMPWNYGCCLRRLSALIFLNWYFILLRNLMCHSRRLVLSFHVASEFIMSPWVVVDDVDCKLILCPIERSAAVEINLVSSHLNIWFISPPINILRGLLHAVSFRGVLSTIVSEFVAFGGLTVVWIYELFSI